MTPSALLFAAAAMIPAMTAPAEGVLHAASESPLAVGLCNGGSISLPLGGSGAPPATAPCCAAKGCRTGARRRRIDRKQ